MMAKKRVLSWLVAASLALSLLPTAVLAVDENGQAEELPALADSLTEAKDLDNPYDEVYETATGAQTEGTNAADTANNETIPGIAGEANETLTGIETGAETEIGKQTDAVNTANGEITEAVNNANQQVQAAQDAQQTAQDETASLADREQAAADAREAADKAAEEAQKADSALKRAAEAVAAAEKAKADAEAAYAEAKAAAEQAVGDAKAAAELAVGEAQAKVEEAQAALDATIEARANLEVVRNQAWNDSEAAEIAARNAEALASEKDSDNENAYEKVDSIKGTYGEGIQTETEEEKQTLTTQTGDALDEDTNLTNQETVQTKAQGVVNAWNELDTLNEIKVLNDAKTELNTANENLNTAKNTTAATTATAKNTKDNGIPDVGHGRGDANTWLDKVIAHDESLKDWGNVTGRITRRDVINTLLSVDEKDYSKWNEYPQWLTDSLITDVLEDATNPKRQGELVSLAEEAKAFIITLGTQVSDVLNNRKTQTEAKGTLDAQIAAANQAAGLTGESAKTDAAELLQTLGNQISAKDPGKKYDLDKLAGEIQRAEGALDTAKTAYNNAYKAANGKDATTPKLEKKSDANQALTDAGKAVSAAQTAYENALNALNATLKSEVMNPEEREATKQLLENLAAKKEAFDNAKALIDDAETKRATANDRLDEYNDARDASQKAHSDFLTAQKAVNDARDALANAKVNGASFKDMKDLEAQLKAAQDAYKTAEENKKLADDAEQAAKEAADEAEQAAEEARRAAEEAIDDITGTDGDTTDDDDTAATIEDGIVPLALMPTRGELMNYLYVRAGSPAAQAPTFTDVPADHAFAAAIGWAQQSGIAAAYEDGTFDPDNFVIAADLTVFLTRYADFAGMTMPALRAMAGLEDDAIVENADEILAEFFGD